MFSMGEFARHGRISVRMLRHYDAIGLLADLNRVIALKDLGFTLNQVQAILAEQGSTAGHGFAIVELPAVDEAATIIHHGSMDDVLLTGQALARWIDANGYRSAGHLREITLEWSADPHRWVTELQQPIYAP